MNVLNLPGWLYPVVLLAFLIVLGAAEYLHLAPSGSWYPVFLIVIGLVAPSPLFPHATMVATPQTNIAASNVDVKG